MRERERDPHIQHTCGMNFSVIDLFFLPPLSSQLNKMSDMCMSNSPMSLK